MKNYTIFPYRKLFVCFDGFVLLFPPRTKEQGVKLRFLISLKIEARIYVWAGVRQRRLGDKSRNLAKIPTCIVWFTDSKVWEEPGRAHEC